MPGDPQTAFVVSHTHWDREWYLPCGRFRTNLVPVVKKVLAALEDDSPFAHFVLDGQAILLEDYLAVCPEDADRLARLARDGALSLGPWYVLPDEFLVSAEATVRNLQIGHQVAGRFGPVQKVGYLPDSFGHIAQLPQILRRAGIDSFVYTRGNGDEIDELGLEYIWRAPDGSEVLALNQHEGYCNAGGLGFAELWHAHTRRTVDPDLAVSRVRELFAGMRQRSGGDVFLLNNGCDHFPPQQDFTAVLAALREAFPATEFRHTGFAAFVAAVAEAGGPRKSYAGELLGGKLHPILSGVWSARMYLKQQNDTCQTLLTDYLEPLSAYGRFVHGLAHPHGQIDAAWRLLLQNHPHDSICGCSTDEVHREMETRFAGVEQAADQLLRNFLQALTPSFARRPEGDRDTVICVANPLPVPRSEVVERLVVLQPFDYDLAHLRLRDQDGRLVPCEILDKRFVQRFWGIDYRTELFGDQQQRLFQVYREGFADRMFASPPAGENGDQVDCFLRLRFLAADLPPLGHALFFLDDRGDQPAAEPTPSVRIEGDSISNECCEVTLNSNGTFDVRDLATGQIFTGLNLLEDDADCGDEYDFCPCPAAETVFAAEVGGAVRVREQSELRCTLEAEFVLPLPEALAPDRRRRADRMVDCPVRTRVTVTAGSPVIEVETVLDNRARDHRLRARFPTGVTTDTVISDGHFHLNRRPLRRPEPKTAADWVQPPARTCPQQDFSLVQRDGRGLAILNRGLPEIEAWAEPDGTACLALTLVRCVGWLSRDDLATRNNNNAGPTIATPDAQCPGETRLHYAVVPFAGDFLAADVKTLSRRYRAPVLAVQGVADQAVPGGTGLLQHVSRRVCVSAVKKHHRHETLVVRLYNLTGEPADETLRFARPVRNAWQTDLLEERLADLAPEARPELPVTLGPHEILTLEVELAKARTS